MERAVYAAIKRTFTSQLAAEKRALLDRVPMLHSLSQVPRACEPAGRR